MKLWNKAFGTVVMITFALVFITGLSTLTRAWVTPAHAQGPIPNSTEARQTRALESIATTLKSIDRKLK
jgi:hypothetical protein